MKLKDEYTFEWDKLEEGYAIYHKGKYIHKQIQMAEDRQGKEFLRIVNYGQDSYLGKRVECNCWISFSAGLSNSFTVARPEPHYIARTGYGLYCDLHGPVKEEHKFKYCPQCGKKIDWEEIEG